MPLELCVLHSFALQLARDFIWHFTWLVSARAARLRLCSGHEYPESCNSNEGVQKAQISDDFCVAVMLPVDRTSVSRIKRTCGIMLHVIWPA